MNAIIFKKHKHPHIQKKLIKRLEQQGVTIEFEPLEELDHPSKSFEFKKDIQWVVNQLSQGNEAAWFCAHVTVKCGELEADTYLGACSYESFEDFTDRYASEYYADMISECVDDLNRQLEVELSGYPMVINTTLSA